MRRIGTVESESQAERLCDYLVTKWIHASWEPGDATRDVHEIWVREEKWVDSAREIFAGFVTAPTDSKYDVVDEAESIRKREFEENRRRLSAQKQVKYRSVGTAGAASRVPLTVAVIVVCSIVSFVTNFSSPRVGIDEFGRQIATTESRAFDALTFVNREVYQRTRDAYASIRQGEVWRIITPALMHGNMGHLAMNMMCIFFLGSAIERIDGVRMYGTLLLTATVVASIVQVAWPLSNGGGPMAVGASGAGYGLVGYLILRPMFDPNYPIRIPQMFQIISVGFLLLGIAKVVPGIANGAHVGGFAAGLVFAALCPASR